MLVIDPLELDRLIERFMRLSSRFQRALRTSDANEHAFELRPRQFDDELLSELASASERDPLLQPLQRWLHTLLVRHACLEAERRVAHARFRDSEPFDQPLRGQFSPQELLLHLLSDSARSAAWLGALERHAARLSTARFQLWETREQALQRFPAAAAPLDSTRLTQHAATRLLEVSRDAFGACEISSFARFIPLALGREAVGEYPTRLTPRSVVELLGENAWLKGLSLELSEVPRSLGSSSWLRAFTLLGSALHRANAERRRPFAVQHDPFERRAACVGALFGLLPLSRSFAERRLSIARARLGDHERSLTRVLLLAARTAAFRALLSAHEAAGTRSYRGAFVELSHQTFGFELAENLAGAWFVRSHAEQELAGLLLALSENADLIERHDEDWFRNPRAIDELRARWESPPGTELDEAALERGNQLLSQQLNSAL